MYVAFACNWEWPTDLVCRATWYGGAGIGELSLRLGRGVERTKCKEMDRVVERRQESEPPEKAFELSM